MAESEATAEKGAFMGYLLCVVAFVCFTEGQLRRYKTSLRGCRAVIIISWRNESAAERMSVIYQAHNSSCKTKITPTQFGSRLQYVLKITLSN